MINQNKINDIRFWNKWVDSGSVHSLYETSNDLIRKMKNPECKTINPHEVAKELTSLYNSNNQKKVLILTHAYAKGIKIEDSNKSMNEARNIARDNLMFAANLADVVAACGYEASGQLMGVCNGIINNDPISKFYSNTVAYQPEK